MSKFEKIVLVLSMLSQKLRTDNTLKLLRRSLGAVCGGWGRVGGRVWEDMLALDGLEGVDVRAFLQLNKGNPPISFFHYQF